MRKYLKGNRVAEEEEWRQPSRPEQAGREALSSDMGGEGWLRQLVSVYLNPFFKSVVRFRFKKAIQ